MRLYTNASLIVPSGTAAEGSSEKLPGQQICLSA